MPDSLKEQFERASREEKSKSKNSDSSTPMSLASELEFSPEPVEAPDTSSVPNPSSQNIKEEQPQSLHEAMKNAPSHIKRHFNND